MPGGVRLHRDFFFVLFFAGREGRTKIQPVVGINFECCSQRCSCGAAALGEVRICECVSVLGG